MRRMRYAPYPMINMIFDKPIYRKGYDNWCPGKTFTDFIVADWTIRQQSRLPAEIQHPHLLYAAPRIRTLHSSRRSRLQIPGRERLRDFQGPAPIQCRPVEIRIYRRGHPCLWLCLGNTRKIG